MKRWQKITGIIVFVILAILNIANCVFYFEYATSLYFEPGGNAQDTIEIMRTYSQNAIKALSYFVFANYIIALFLFIYLWRKGCNK